MGVIWSRRRSGGRRAGRCILDMGENLSMVKGVEWTGRGGWTGL